MDLKSNKTYWNYKEDDQPSFPQIRTDINCDILIVGGGVSGALIAYQLKDLNADIVLIDKNRIASESTAASTALINYELDKTLLELKEMYGLEKAIKIYKYSHHSVQEITRIVHQLKNKSDYARVPSIYIAHNKTDAEFLRKEVDLRNSVGFDVEFLEKEELKNKYQINSPGAVSNRDSGILNPIEFTTQLIQEFIRYGNKVYEKTEAIIEKNSSEGIILKTDEGRTINAQKVIWAGGYPTQKLVNEPNIKLISTYVFVSQKIENSPINNMQVWEHADPYFYARSLDERIMVGGEDIETPNPDIRDELIDEKIDLLLKRFNEVYPDLQIEPQFKWAGTFAESVDSLPYFGELEEYPNFFFIIPCGGNGITFSSMGGLMAKDWILGKEIKHQELFKFRR